MSFSDPPPEETTRHSVAFAPLYRSQPRIAWNDGDGHHSVKLETPLVVGSASGSGIVVHDGTVSRLHAEFDPREDGLWVRDLGSRNGTFIDGLQITGARVPEHGKVRLGAVEFTVDYGGPRRAVEVWPDAHFFRLVGRSLAMRELFATLARVAPTDSSVLIHGETGTGKELVARAIHDASPRASKPFVVVDCAALPENLLDAELFGHTRGAFTGALSARIGAIESADGGTVFLDEIGELPAAVQPKLLRVLESRTVRRLGETSHRSFDVRFLSATHRDLVRMVSEGEFREDLYFRLAVLPLTVPPLRQRKEDIETLVNHFLGQLEARGAVSLEVVRELAQRPWRGNVRELKNFVERARALGAPQALALTRASPLSESPQEPTEQPPENRALSLDDPAMFDKLYKDFRESWVDAGEREYVRRLITRHNRNVAAAAKAAGVDRTYIYRLIRKHDL